MTHKLCRMCGETKPLDQFKKDGRSRDGYQKMCQLCSGSKESTSSALAHHRDGRTDLMLAQPATTRSITSQTYARMFRSQHGVCAVCHQPETTQNEYGEKLQLTFYGADHNGHVVRGLVCKFCNMGLSMFKDSPVILARAIEFLTRRAPSFDTEIRVTQQ